ncbi:putative transcription factor & chromatin remodeling ARID-HMG family [Lupinus albus]|uniref:Putative transcription factor & chromatin remodeling ARID-HMG family n=1 Tax=Lupinus albus TaxID=3870 RepID=A0A6A4NXT1_LUPAL|nr:putative transcription factor & chromatin remodeling ARID-HMG family [Lupinus albus]
MTTTASEEDSTKQIVLFQNQSEGPNGNFTNNPYPMPTALYDDLVRDGILFLEKLQSFHNSFGTKFKVPTIGGKPLDLYRLFLEVTSRGGLEKVIEDRKWREVVMVFNFRDTITSASFMVRRYYLSLLYHFEQVYYFRKQVPPSLTPDPLNRSLVNYSATIREGGTMNGLSDQVTQLGSVVLGTIDSKFDGGYVVTVNLGSEQLKGILYHDPTNVSWSSYTERVLSSQYRKRSRLALRDPSQPKSNRSGYNFFFAENYARLKPSFHGQEREISKRIGFLWSNLTDAERQVYQEKGLKDKERYRREMLKFKSNNSSP